MTDKEKYESLVAEIEHQKKETSIGLNEWENGEEHGRMDVINALQEKIKSMQGEPANDDLEKEVYEHLWKGRMGADVSKPIYFSYDELLEVARHFAAWQKEQIMANSTNATIGLPYENKDGGYTHLIDVSRPLPVGKNKIAIIFKED